MLKNLLFFGIGFFVCRRLMLSQTKEEYLEKEEVFLDRIQNKVHDLIKKVAPQYNDKQVGEMVIEATEGGKNESDTSGPGGPQ